MPLTERFRRALQAGRDAVTGELAAEAPGQVAAALVIGPGLGELTAARAWLRRAQGGPAILITDQTEVGLYQEPGLVTEFLPTGRWHEADPARRLYVQRRLAVIFAKWAVTHCAAIGPDAERLFAKVRTGVEASGDMPKPARSQVT